ncbi:tapasin [Bombina bombina]|uniref:tapasin n=1 Tax=Bombina bombina TaxID=8345 RepID=UPI00235A6AC7|nr:tapasin [Bombina bombina]
MIPSTIYKMSLIYHVLGIVLFMNTLVSGNGFISCWYVEEIPGTATKPKSIQQTPVHLVLTDTSSLTPAPAVIPEEGTLVYYVTDSSGKLRSREFTNCEMTEHLPQEVSLDWARSLTKEEISPPSLGRTWYSMSARDETDGYSVSAVLGPQGEKDDHLAVTLAVYTPSVSQFATFDKPMTIPCGLWRGQQSRFSVEWRHRALGDGTVLYAYDGRLDRVAEAAPDCRMNFTALHSSGDASLTLEKADVRYQGTFLCTVYLPYVRAQRDIQLKVTAVPQVTLLPDPLFGRPDEELTLTCAISHFHPLEISVEFLVRLPGEPHSTLLSGTTLSPHSRNQDGTFSMTASLRINVSAQHHGARYSCRVYHVSSKEGLTRSRTLQVAGISGPSIEDGMYLFVTALILYGIFSLLHKKVVPLFSTSETKEDAKGKAEKKVK